MRFVIITLPPPEAQAEIEALRRPWNAAVGALEALRYPPHVTLRTGLVCPDDRVDEVAQAFFDHAVLAGRTVVRTSGLFLTSYGPLGAERGMVGWSVTSDGGLDRLHRHLLEFTDWAKGPQGEFRPHLSAVYGDLDLPGLDTLRRILEPADVPDFAWTIDHVALYHELPGGWVEWGRASLA